MQKKIIESFDLDPIKLGGKMVDGKIFKPDAEPEHRGKCMICGSSGVWICGAGSYLCHNHQDSY